MFKNISMLWLSIILGLCDVQLFSRSIPLSEEALNGNWIEVKRRIDQGENVNDAYNATGFTALHVATVIGNWEMFQYLIDHGCDVNALNAGGRSSLHILVNIQVLDAIQALDSGILKDDRLEFIKYLVEHGADINLLDCDGKAPLHLAAFAILDTVSYLIEKGANVNIVDKTSHSSLYNAVAGGNLEIVRTLVEAGADLNIENGELLGTAAIVNEDILYYLLGLRRNLNINSTDLDGNTVLHAAVIKNDLQLVRALIEKGAKSVANRDGMRPEDFYSSEKMRILLGQLNKYKTYA